MRKRWVVIGLIAAAIFGLGRDAGHDSAKHAEPEQTQRQSVRVPQRDAPPEGVSDDGAIEPQKVAPSTLFVRGQKVALREGPGKTFRVIDRYNTGREVEVFQVSGGWCKVRDRLTRREGWISSALLTNEKRARAKKEPTKVEPKKKKPIVVETPSVSNSTIVQRIIAESIAGYSGSCPCPYNVDRGGRRCGKRSAYSKPGGAAPVCFAGDVSRQMIEAFR